jgi:hypothetical protein
MLLQHLQILIIVFYQQLVTKLYFHYFLVEKSTAEAIFNLLPAHCAPAPLPVWQQ